MTADQLEVCVCAAEVAALKAERDEQAAIIKATGHELDAMRSQVSAAEARRTASDYRARRIGVDAAEARAEKADAALGRQVRAKREAMRPELDSLARSYGVIAALLRVIDAAPQE